MRMFIDAWNAKFQSEKYPINFYLHNLQEIQTARTPEKLGKHIIALLHWKDGKVKKDVNGDVTVGNDNYLLLPTKPNTFHNTKHKEILVSERFYHWARELIILNSFVATKGEDLKNVFHLYGKESIVIPTFILHILSPLIYPLYDQHVERAKRAFLAQNIHFNSNDLI